MTDIADDDAETLVVPMEMVEALFEPWDDLDAAITEARERNPKLRRGARNRRDHHGRPRGLALAALCAAQRLSGGRQRS
ncbi:hypothetical protein ACRAWD_05275 [Caulobacter segnis]